jgi:hypothetical protein
LLAGAHTLPPPFNGAQQPLLQSVFKTHAMAQIDPRTGSPVSTQ